MSSYPTHGVLSLLNGAFPRMRILSKWAVLSIGVLFHLSFLMSIFDIYFVSPLVHGMRHFHSANPDPAKRLFLIVGDGLRADKFYEPQVHPSSGQNEVLAPYMMDKVHNLHAMSGISHTRMPTESRPGHVALIAGFYEDVSAVTKGWQTNPVDFDSVFNQSSHTWSFGSPDILPMFSIGATPGVVDMDCYDHTFEDFTRSSIDLDQYSFDGINELFDAAATNATLDAQLRAPGVVIFLHLLGIDNAGHFKRPYSAEYYDNIKYVDAAIEKFEQRVEKFYHNDGETAFVFTADHGMSDFGSHGDGHPNNTRTPLVAWGKGVRKPEKKEIMQATVQQADIANLMAYLVGVNFPANTVGELPTQYLNASPETKAWALAANADAIAEQYLVKQSRVMSAQMHFKPFPKLSGEESVELRRARIHEMLREQRWTEAIDEAESLMAEGLKGLRYLQQYNWLELRTLVTLGFLGWIAFALTSFLHLFVAKDISAQPSVWVSSVFFALFSGPVGMLKLQKSPLNYYLYAIFPSLFWYVVASNYRIWKVGLAKLLNGPEAKSIHISLSQVLGILGGVALLEGIVRGYFHRELFSVMLLVVFIPWPFFANWRTALAEWPVTLLWVVSCSALAVFGTLPVNKVENIGLITGSGFAMAALSFLYIVHLNRSIRLTTVTMVTAGFQLSLIILANIVTRRSVESLSADCGLPIGSQLMGWMTLLFSVLIPFMHSLAPVSDYRFRILNIFMLFSPTMIILSISYEGYFYVAFALLLYAWLQLETALADANDGNEKQTRGTTRPLSLGTFRLALTFLFFTHIAFFATGNIASISSFSLDSVYRLIPIFNPFSMGALLIIKILVPFVLLSVVLGIINLRVRLPKYALFSMVLAVSDVLSLNFFYMVVDEGSWLDIGTGISHYCICSMLCLFLSIIEYLSAALVSGVEV